MRNGSLIFFLCLTQFAFHLNAQSITQIEQLQTVSQLVVELGLGLDVENDVDVYRVEYTTTNVENSQDTASGLLLLPVGEGPFPQAIYQHGTVNSRQDVPSNLAGGWELGLAISSFGFVTVVPDFQGLGISPGIHTYVHAESEALAAIDLLIAVQDFLDETQVAVNDQLFITGYSQGGHAAMAAHIVLERDFADQFTVTASSPMSGPYSISGDMVDFTLGDGEYDFIGYLIWTTLSYQRVNDELPTIEEIYKPQFIPAIEQFRNEEITLGELNNELISLILMENELVQPRLLLQEDILEIILSGVDHPINNAFRENDVFDFLPNAPIRMMYCGMDEQVTFQNALTAEAAMLENGAEDVQAVLIDENGTHGTCVIPASIATIEFFRSFLDQTSPVDDFAITPFSLFPNPTNDWITIKADFGNQPTELIIYDLLGKRMMQVMQPDSRIDVSDLTTGSYIFQLIDNGEVFNSTITIAR